MVAGDDSIVALVFSAALSLCLFYLLSCSYLHSHSAWCSLYHGCRRRLCGAARTDWSLRVGYALPGGAGSRAGGRRSRQRRPCPHASPRQKNQRLTRRIETFKIGLFSNRQNPLVVRLTNSEVSCYAASCAVSARLCSCCVAALEWSSEAKDVYSASLI